MQKRHERVARKDKDPRKKPRKPKDVPVAGANTRLSQQTRKQLAKHYASKYKARPR